MMVQLYSPHKHPSTQKAADHLLTASREGDPQALATILWNALLSRQINLKVGLRSAEGLLYISLKLAKIIEQDDICLFLEETLRNLNLPWLQVAEVNGFISGQDAPLWRKELILSTQPPIASQLMQQEVQDVRIHIDRDSSGPIIIGNNNHQTFINYNYHVEHGGVLNIAPHPVVEARPLPINLRPQPFQNILDRKPNVATILQSLESDQSFELYGIEGYGKTSLIRYLVYDSRATASFSDGVIYLSGYQLRFANDLLQELYKAFYESCPNYIPSSTEIQHCLKGKKALIILDELDIEKAGIDSLVTILPHAFFIVISTKRCYWLSGSAEMLKGLPLRDSLLLLEQELGRSLAIEERPYAEQLCQKLEGHPLQLKRSAAIMKDYQKTVTFLLESLESEASFFQKILDILPNSHHQILALLGAMGGVALAAEDVSAMLHIPDVTTPLRELYHLHLVNISTFGKHVSYQLQNDLIQFSQQFWSQNSLLSNAVEYFTRHASSDSLVRSQDALQYLTDWTAQANHWQECHELSHLLDRYLSLKGYLSQSKHILEQSLLAAKESGNLSAEAWSIHQLGTLALCTGHSKTAETALTQALRLRESIGDLDGAAVSRHNLGFIVPPLVPPDPTLLTSVLKSSNYNKVILASAGVLLVGAALFLSFFRSTKSAVLEFSNRNLDFGDRTLNSASTSTSLTLNNIGSLALIIDEVQLSGNSDEFQIVENNCLEEAKLEPRNSCTINIMFFPLKKGHRKAQLDIKANGKDYLISLVGRVTTKLAPSISFEPSSLFFNDLPVNTAQTQTVQLNNDGTAPIKINNLLISGTDYTVIKPNNSCFGKTLSPQNHCSFQVQFKPIQGGMRRARLNIEGYTDDTSLALSGFAVENPEQLPPVHSEPEPPVSSEPEPPVSSEPKPPVSSEPKPPVSSEPKPPVSSEPKPPVSSEPKPPVSSEPKPPVSSEPKPPVSSEPKPPVSSEPKPPVSSEPKPPVSSEPKPPVSSEPKPPVSSEPKPHNTDTSREQCEQLAPKQQSPLTPVFSILRDVCQRVLKGR